MKSFFRFVVTLLLLALIVGSIGWYLLVFDRDFTRDMLLKQARFYDSHNNPQISAWFYNLAYAHSGNDETVAIELANQYMNDGNFTKAEVTLSRAIHAEASPELYTALCRAYVKQDKLMDAVALLAGVPDAGIRAQLEAMRPEAPTSDTKPGFYSQYMKVNLHSNADRLLYTTTGEYPSTTNAPYSEPITLPGGETVIYAIAVNDSGLVSPLSILGYTVGGVIEPAVFMDPNMEQAVRDALDISPSAIVYTNDLWEITSFVVPSNVTSLDDLAMMPYLETLAIVEKQFDSLAPLSGLSKLKTLEISSCRFPAAELAVLAKLPELRRLTITDCAVSSLAALEGANRLEYLDLSFNSIRNLEVLSGMTGLKELYLPHNALNDLSVLSGLTNLEKLDVASNSLTTLAPLNTCVKMTWLNAEDNQLTDAAGVATMVMLESLSLDYNHITDISYLGACIQLKELSVSNNKISDISSLSSLTVLDVFDISYNDVSSLPAWPDGCTLRAIDCTNNSIESIDVLGKMKNLTYVSADYNKITNINALSKCPTLVQVNVYGNAIADVTALSDQGVIVNYDPTAA